MTQGACRPENMHTLWSTQQLVSNELPVLHLEDQKARPLSHSSGYTHSPGPGSHLVCATTLNSSFPDLPQSFLFASVWALDDSEQSSIEAGQRPEHRSNRSYCFYWTHGQTSWSAWHPTLGTIFDADELEFTRKKANRNVRRGQYLQKAMWQ